MDEETKKTLDLCLKIVKRAKAMGIARGSQMTQMMDLDARTGSSSSASKSLQMPMTSDSFTTSARSSST